MLNNRYFAFKQQRKPIQTHCNKIKTVFSNPCFLVVVERQQLAFLAQWVILQLSLTYYVIGKKIKYEINICGIVFYLYIVNYK